MPPGSDVIGIDSNVLIYALDRKSGVKHDVARKLVAKCMRGEIALAISNQVLAETLFNIEEGVPIQDIADFVDSIQKLPSWKKLVYSHQTVSNVLIRKEKTDFWDTLIAETLKENNIPTIYTENTKDFEKIPGVKATNPFRPKK